MEWFINKLLLQPPIVKYRPDKVDKIDIACYKTSLAKTSQPWRKIKINTKDVWGIDALLHMYNDNDGGKAGRLRDRNDKLQTPDYIYTDLSFLLLCCTQL